MTDTVRRKMHSLKKETVQRKTQPLKNNIVRKKTPSEERHTKKKDKATVFKKDTVRRNT